MVGVVRVAPWEVWRIDEYDEMSWLLPSLHRIPLVLRPGPIIWRRATASDVIWRNTVGEPAATRHFSSEAYVLRQIWNIPKGLCAFADSVIKVTHHHLREERSSPLKDLIQHLFCQLAGEGVLLGGVIGTKQRSTSAQVHL
jgi:hypothetical protein